jgi:hypothetical protein
VDNVWKNYYSSSLPVKYGVLHCPALGALLSVIYVNNVPKLIRGMSFMYAAETSILNIGEILAELKKVMYANKRR